MPHTKHVSRKRRTFNAQWRKDRKVLKRARREGLSTLEILNLAEKYKIDYPREKIA